MKKILIVLGCLFLCSCLFAAEVNRYAVYVGSNRGGKNRTNLLYAGTDAEAIRNTMKEIGGIPDNNGVLLIDPSKKEIEAAISNISKKIKSNNSNGRSEFLFYYSGHSDEDSLLLGENRFDYSDLKAKISDVPSDVHVVILDSCYSGNFIRTKGGVKQKPFLIDDSSVVKGHAYLSSSSENEYSQESDEVEGSFFTNALVSGLRGAADADKDKKVTLNELYSYAFNDTLSKTEETQAGPQHPNYNITLVGSGDLVLSDFSDAEALVTIARELEGKVLIRDKNDKLVSEVNKLAGTPVIMALSEGDYTVTVITAAKTVQGNIKITKKETTVISTEGMKTVELAKHTVRGGVIPPVKDENGYYTFLEENSYHKNTLEVSLSGLNFLNMGAGEAQNIILNMTDSHEAFTSNDIGLQFRGNILSIGDFTAAWVSEGKISWGTSTEAGKFLLSFGVGAYYNGWSKNDLCGPNIMLYPVSNFQLSATGIWVNPEYSFWKWQSAVEVGYTFKIMNLTIRPYVKDNFLFGYKKVVNVFDGGINIGYLFN